MLYSFKIAAALLTVGAALSSPSYAAKLTAANQPFEDVTSLERAYPPAHLMCWKEAGRK
jgi:hypothetical protein